MKDERGRPTVMTPENIEKLEEGFLKGFSDRESCLYAKIAPSTLYAFCQENPDFSERKELLKEQVKMKAKDNIQAAIHAGDKLLSQWYLERRDKDFKPKSDLTSDDKPIPILINAISNNNSDQQNSEAEAENQGDSGRNSGE